MCLNSLTKGLCPHKPPQQPERLTSTIRNVKFCSLVPVETVKPLETNLNKISGFLGVPPGEEGEGRSTSAVPSGSADPVDVVFRVSRVVVVDDELDVVDVEAAGGNVGGDLEELKGLIGRSHLNTKEYRSNRGDVRAEILDPSRRGYATKHSFTSCAKTDQF